MVEVGGGGGGGGSFVKCSGYVYVWQRKVLMWGQIAKGQGSSACYHTFQNWITRPTLADRYTHGRAGHTLTRMPQMGQIWDF